MERTFNIDGIYAGWIVGNISDSNDSYYFHASYLTDFPNDLMLALLTALGDWDPDERKDRFKVEMEPAVSKLQISLEGKELVFDIATFESEHAEREKRHDIVRVDKDRFLDDFLSTMSDVLHKFGLLGYRKEWSYEFPLSLYLKLYDLHNGNRIKTEQGSAKDNIGQEYVRTDLDVEKGLIGEI